MRIIDYIQNFLFILMLQKSRGEYTCNSDWKLVGDTCIGVFTKIDEKVTWHVARDKCHKLNSTLVTIRSSVKQTLISPLFIGDAWIDQIKDSSSDKFRWANGDPTVDYESWQIGQPNNGGEGCAVLSGNSGGYWADRPCFDEYYYICEKVSETNGCQGTMVLLAGKCYSFSNDTKKWFDAREECQKNGGDLLVIENALKNDIISSTDNINENSQRRHSTFWIGASDFKEEGKWRWLDQKDVMTYQNWSKGSPDNGGNGIHSCVYMASTYRITGEWKTNNCDVFYSACCERRTIHNNGVTTCDGDWQLYNNSICIGMILNGSTWAGARQKCNRVGGDLVVIKDSIKSTFVRRLVNMYLLRPTWIGLRDINLNEEWNWLDSTEKATFLDWSADYPRESLMRKFNCVFMRSTSYSKGRWSNSLCSVAAAYICEMVQTGPCSPGWHSFGGHCYKFNYDISNYDQVRRRCKLLESKSDLVVIDNHAEQVWLQDKIDPSADVIGLWIGLHSKHQKYFFVWLNGTTQASYTNWDAGMPSYLKSEACVSATGSYRKAEWKDEDCMRQNGYLCEKSADGDASYYDFRYKNSVYKVVMSQFTTEHGNEYCKKILGVNSTLILLETQDEMNYITRELDIRALTRSNLYWTKGNFENTPTTLYTTPRPPSNNALPDYASRICLQLWFKRHSSYQNRIYKPKLQLKPCCGEAFIICEKHLDPKLTMDNKYDFALNSSIYRLVDEEMLDHDSANSKCADLLDNTGSLAEFETWDELEAVSREVLARHIGKHFIYWVGGDPLDENSTSVDPKVDSDGDSHCMIIEYDPANSNANFIPIMTLKSTKCIGEKTFLCEQKGIKTNVIGSEGNIKFGSDYDYRAKILKESGCIGPCIGLAVALPFLIIGAVLITVAYFLLIRRQSPPVKFSHTDDEAQLAMSPSYM